MARYGSGYPAGYFDDEDNEYYADESPKKYHVQESENQNFGIKVIQPLGNGAGLNKCDFDIKLDENSQQWFNQIYQYWKQCKIMQQCYFYFAQFQKKKYYN